MQLFIEILKIGVPGIVMLCSALFVEVVNTSFVGHIGQEAMMAGVGMANMYVNICCLSIIFGLTHVLNTLVSQSFGTGNIRLCGIYFYRARILITLALIPMLVFLLNAEILFDYLGFDPEASQYSQIYIRLIIPALYLLALVDTNRRLLSCMGI